ncbi:hypothetical protein PTI98_010824 [Pleurotus ostreatus]|nr:hypothetical protein PTI98_010824 [Pleurotus ostreatus]
MIPIPEDEAANPDNDSQDLTPVDDIADIVETFRKLLGPKLNSRPGYRDARDHCNTVSRACISLCVCWSLSQTQYIYLLTRNSRDLTGLFQHPRFLVNSHP